MGIDPVGTDRLMRLTRPERNVFVLAGFVLGAVAVLGAMWAVARFLA